MMLDVESDEEKGPKELEPKESYLTVPESTVSKSNVTSTRKANVYAINKMDIPTDFLPRNPDDVSIISSEGLTQNYAIDNLSPTWGIMLVVQDNLNLRIGIQVKKKYFNAAFWNYISTPINFAITLFTALSAGQTGSSTTFVTKSQLFYILVTTFILSTVNTFFKLREKADINYKSAKMWESYAGRFEQIYFTPLDDINERLSNYNNLIEKINMEVVEESVEYVNYITELIFYLCHMCRKTADHRYLSIYRRHWMLDGISCADYLYKLRNHPEKQTYPTTIPPEVDGNVFRKTIQPAIKEERSFSRRLIGCC